MMDDKNASDDALILTEADSGRDVPVAAGQVIELRLPENPATGFRWAFTDHAGVEIIADQNDLTRDLAPGTASGRVFRLRVLGGDSHIILQRGQAWEPSSPPDAMFDLHLKTH